MKTWAMLAKQRARAICNGLPKLLCICILTGCHMHTADVF